MKQRTAFSIAAAIITLILIGCWFLPMSHSHSQWHTPERESLVRLRSLAQGCIIYAFQNGDQFPNTEEWKSLLIAAEVATPDHFVSPKPGVVEDSYIFVPTANMFDGSSILLYENPAHWVGFVNVAFADASTEQLPHDEFEHMLAEQRSSTADGP